MRGARSVLVVMSSPFPVVARTTRRASATGLAWFPARVWHPVRVNATVHERRAPAGRRQTRRRSRGSRLPFFLLGFLLVAAGAAVVAAYAYDHARRDTIAPGVRIGGGDGGGLTPAAARRRIVAQAVVPRRRTLTVHAHGHTFTLPASRARITADIDGVLDRALADSRHGWRGQRVAHGLSKKHVDESLSLPIHYAPGVVASLTARVADAVRRSPVDASVKPSGSGLSLHRSHSASHSRAAAD